MKTKIYLLGLLLCPGAMWSQDLLYPNEFPLGDVNLLDGPFKHACDLNISTLLKYDTDRLLAPYLKQAGLPAKAESFDNWIGLDGHVGGHYLTALAIHYAATGNEDCLNRLNYMIDELDRCQQASPSGYVGGVELACWDRIQSGNVQAVWDYWVPWYNIHKTMAGLRDAYSYAHIQRARDMFVKLCDWSLSVIAPLSDEQMESMLANEFGGMDEVLADAYQLTGEQKYLDAAKRFSHHWLLDSMAAGIDNLDNKHANTQVPKVVGYQRIAELSQNPDDKNLYDHASQAFWNFVVNDRSLAIGGNSRREHFASAEDCVSYVEDREGPESCNTNNMLKLTEGLFRMHGDAKYADFYERAMYNHILSTQHPEHGGYVYFTSARPGHYRVYSTPNSAMWCCVGTGMENHGKYGQFVYPHHADTLDVNLFLASELNWREKNFILRQDTQFPYSETSIITCQTEKPQTLTINIRNPWWTKDGKLKIKVNGEEIKHANQASSYVAVTRQWKAGDKIELEMPMATTLEYLPNSTHYVAIMHGPMVLGSRWGTDDLGGLVSDDGRWSHIAHGKLMSIFDTPFLIGTPEDIKAKLESLDNDSLHYDASNLFTVPNQNGQSSVVLEPFTGIHDCRYVMYFPIMTEEQFSTFQEKVRNDEAEKLRLDAITIDAIALAEQQPEVDHSMRQQGSSTGNTHGEAWRAANNDKNFFEYTMATGGMKNISLIVRSLAQEERNLQIYINDNLLVTESKLDGEGFINKTYSIPEELLSNNNELKVTLRPSSSSSTGRISHLRIIKD